MAASVGCFPVQSGCVLSLEVASAARRPPVLRRHLGTRAGRASAILCVVTVMALAGCGNGDGNSPSSPRPLDSQLSPSTTRSAGTTAVPGTTPSNAPTPGS
jgi:hypothetical protein